jgi:hypothetical protein
MLSAINPKIGGPWVLSRMVPKFKKGLKRFYAPGGYITQPRVST